MRTPPVPRQDTPISDVLSAVEAKLQAANPKPPRFSMQWWRFFEAVASSLAVPLKIANSGTHADRLLADPANYPANATWDETDRAGLVYQIRTVLGVPAWVFARGEMACLQADLPADLGTNDANLLVRVTDYSHRLVWSGSAWSFADGERSCYIENFMVDPSPTTGWSLCDGKGDDGSAIGVAHPVKYLKSDGSLGSITSATVAPCKPDLVSASNKAAYVKLGGTATGVNVAVGPTFTGGSFTPAGTVSAPVFTGSAGTTGATSGGTPAGTNSAPAFTGSAGTTGATSGGTPAGTNSAPAFAGSALAGHQHTLPIGFDGATTNIYVDSSQNSGSSFVANYVIPLTASVVHPGLKVLSDSISAGTPAGTVGAPTFTGSALSTHTHSFTPAGTVAAPTFTGTALGTHTHSFTPAGTNSVPTFTGTPSAVSGSIGADGEPQNIVLRPWFRK